MKPFLTAVKAAAILVAGAVLFSCTKTKVVELSVSPLAVNFEVTGGEQSVSISCNDAWTVAKTADWVTLSATSGEGNATLKITVAENKTVNPRYADVTITAGELKRTVTVGQLGLDPAMGIGPSKVEADDQGGTFDINVTANIPWTLTIPAEASWVTADKTSGEGSAVLKLTVAPNETVEERSAELTIASNDFFTFKISVKQAGQAKRLTVELDKLEASYEGGSFGVPVSSNMAWTVSIPENAPWLTADKTEGEKDGLVTFVMEKNIYRQGRSTTVVISAGEGLSISLPVSQGLAPISRQTDSLVLVAIYHAADGANWKEERRWDLSTPIDQWDGVTVTDDRVTKFQITAASVIPAEWTMPHEVADLTELTVLKVNQNKLAGEIPEEIYTLTKLTDLWFQNDNLSGVISEKLSQLTELKNLYIDRNANLGGSIPATIGQLKKLENINISKTGIGGAIPQELVGCEALVNFMAYENKLSGQVPDFWDQFKNVGIIQLYNNPGLEGPLPASCGRATTTAKNYSLRFDGCNFTGNIPESYATLPSVCKQFWAKGNKLNGVVPAGVQAHANWANWKAADNILPQQEGYGLSLYDGSGGQDLDEGVDVDPWK